MRKSILALMAAGSIFALTAAGASAGLNLGEPQTFTSGDNSGTVTVAYDALCADTFDVAYTQTAGLVTQVVVADTSGVAAAANCKIGGSWSFAGDNYTATANWSDVTHGYTFNYSDTNAFQIPSGDAIDANFNLGVG